MNVLLVSLMMGLLFFGGVIVGYFLPSRKKQLRDLLIETESSQFESLSEIKHQLIEIDYWGTVGKLFHRQTAYRSDPERIHVKEEIERLLKELEKIFSLQKISISTTFSDGRLLLNISEKEFRHILLALILNAIEALPQGGKIQIKMGRERQNIFIEVEDSGSGISSALSKRLFEPFYTTKRFGSGLGLYSVKSSVEKYQGKVLVKTIPSGGTTLKLLFPARESIS